MNEARREMDVRNPETRAAIDALAPGAAIVLVSAEAPRELLEELQEDAPGRFEWSILEANSERSRIELRRRRREEPRTVTAYLQADHERLDAIVPDVERLIGAGSFAEAQARFSEFVAGLSWHIDVEEKVLFPTFEAKTGMKTGPTGVMRHEHIDIRAAMAQVSAALLAKDAAAVHQSLGELVPLLSSHNMKEERMLYPMIDRAMESVEKLEALVRRIEIF